MQYLEKESWQQETKQEGGLFPVLELPLVIKVLGSGVTWNQMG